MKPLVEYWLTFFQKPQDDNWWQRKRRVLKRREAEIVHLKAKGHIYNQWRYDDMESVHYVLHVTLLIKQAHAFYIEEHRQSFSFQHRQGTCMVHDKLTDNEVIERPTEMMPLDIQREKTVGYDRRAAVQYAEHWWNQYNPNFQQFTVDCTNYVSQCLLAGGAPMRGHPNRDQGWWYDGDSWSYSWSVAHSLRWYLSGATHGLRGIEVETASQLKLGDIICYDFEGDGRWDHNTIVVAKDLEGEPLVNAHTDNSRHRFWSYEDSTAWTPNMQYKFFQIEVTS